MVRWTTANHIGDSGAIKIGESLMMNTTLTELNLGSVIENKRVKVNRMKKQKEKYEIMIKWTDNEIGASGAIKISESLMKNITLTTLDLRSMIGKWELM